RPDAIEPGDIVHLDGRVLGTHRGVLNFTIGQRRGLGLPGGAADGEPLYVVKLDAAARRVVVGPREALATRRVPLSSLNWLGDVAIEDLAPEGVALRVKVRSTRPPVPAILVPGADGPHVILCNPEEGVAPGQACVFYAEEGTRVLGGGWIARGE
ncbi:MAG: tRNA methyl transferase PRC-barrel domain-containing protein, partial [Pseudomonadota bacterium]